MIFEEKMFGVKCDGCGEACGNFDHDYAVYPDKDDAAENATDQGWAEIGESHFCPACMHKYVSTDEDGEWKLTSAWYERETAQGKEAGV